MNGLKGNIKAPLILAVLGTTLFPVSSRAEEQKMATAIDAYILPYAQSNNFSGAVRVEKGGQVIFQKAYASADRKQKIPYNTSTRFHIASVSMQFTAAAIMRLVDEKKLQLTDKVGDLLPETPNANQISIQDLLTERSGLPDINELPDYDAILQEPQTPASLVAKIAGRPLLFKPGTQFLHEEHLAYNLLALLIEKKTGVHFKEALCRLVFQPLHLDATFADDDSVAAGDDISLGYQPVGVDGLERARNIHWSAKTGNGSICATVADQARWMEALFNGHALSESSTRAILDPGMRAGYGWFKGESKRFNEVAYYMNGRAPGFASFVLYLPRESVKVIVFSNIYSSATTDIGYDIASLVIGKPYHSFQSMKKRFG